MPTLQQKIAEQFLEKLATSAEFDGDKVEQLRQLLRADKKVKAEDLVRIFSRAPGGDLK